MNASKRLDGWFRVAEPEHGVFLIEEPWHDEQVKSYLITGSERAVLLDTGMGVGDLRATVEPLTDRPITVVLSHAHWDHIGGAHQFAGDAEILIHPLAAAELRAGIGQDRMRRYLAAEHLSGPYAATDLAATAVVPGVEPTGLIDHGHAIDVGDRTLKVLHTPGHTAGLIALWDPVAAVLYSTDAVYSGALYAQIDDSNLKDYLTTLDLLMRLAPAPRRLYPAHGPSPITPDLLPAMREAMARVIAGREPEARAGDTATFEFGEFSIIAAWPPATEAAS